MSSIIMKLIFDKKFFRAILLVRIIRRHEQKKARKKNQKKSSKQSQPLSQKKMNDNNNDESKGSCPNDNDVLIGPDLNASRSPFDKKNYRQILLPNGLRALLVSDVVAMTQSYNLGEGFDDEENSFTDDDDDDTDDADDNDNLSLEDSDDEEEEGSGIRNAAAAMLVGGGSFYDPVECQGMAHFLEHLLFMGSEKYPEENCYGACVIYKRMINLIFLV